MTATLTEPENPQIREVYGPLLDKTFATLKGLEVEDFKPATGTIVVKQAAPETVTEGGLHLPESAQKETNFGAVVAVNCDDRCPYSVGDLVFFRKGGYFMELHEGDKYLILQYRGCIDDEILGKFSPKKTVDGKK